MQQVFEKMFKRCHYQGLTILKTKQEVLVFKGVSNNVTLDDYKDLLEFNKITHAEAERMKSRNSGNDLPFIKVTM